MSQNPRLYSTPTEQVIAALTSLKTGQGVLVVDNEDRENEGDLIFSAASLNREQMAMLIRECSGIVCLCITSEKASALELSLMVENNTSRFGTAFTVSIEAASGVTTGVSAVDRITTIKAAIKDSASALDICKPGHIFPLIARPGGVLERQGHTEATVDLMRLAGLPPYGVLCELTNKDGSMAKMPEIMEFSRQHNIPVVSVKDIISYRTQREGQRDPNKRVCGDSTSRQYTSK
ncbi:MAG: 3,4-dihydroxy-2-butanone-4-phosphate synthase [Endomicrobium sp.]|jgi:3,4-dihydroxy 2-butanone 4-phosphate synthase|nr:3,4-dihydroxy-2-butanone-4-phosphate synthase [Endomicrobium sp.]